MPAFTPEFIARASGGRWTAPPRAPLSGFATDSRQLRPGEGFVAIASPQRDGHDFLGAAAAAGAAAAIVAAPRTAAALPQLVVADPVAAFQAIARAHRRAFPGTVAAITGSAGKTSTKNLLALLLGAAPDGRDSAVLATEGNLNNHLGVPLTLTRLEPQRHQFAVIEAGISAPGEMAPLAEMIEPDLAIVTLVAPAHLAELGALEGVAREKAILAAGVRPGGRAIFSPATAGFAAFRALTVPTEIVTAAVRQLSDATEVLLGGDTPGPFRLRQVSAGMAGNAALAIGAALRLGIPAALIQSRLAFWSAAPLRGEVRQHGGRTIYLDCYNANPAAMSDALAAFAVVAPPGTPRLFVLGCMEELGPESGTYHRALGAELRLGPDDRVVIIGEQAEQVRAGARGAGARDEQVMIAPDAAAAAGAVEGFSGAILIKGSRRYRLETLAPGAAGALQGTH
jgi:UDP-N-acetylmuramoyl-tripeptide--D-alanyl-D-alanine ligase